MGETAKLRNGLMGGFGLNDYFEQGDGSTTVGRLLKTLLPTVDLRDFQRRYEFSTVGQTVLVGELWDALWTVPRGETWMPRAVAYTNKDSGQHVISVTLELADNLGLILARTTVESGQTAFVFGAKLNADVRLGAFQADAPTPIESGFKIRVVDLTAGVEASVAQGITIIYELVPQPATPLTAGPDPVVTVV